MTQHKTLNSSKGIIRDRNLKGESEENIKEYLENQGVTNVKRFKVKKIQGYVNTNTILLTFNTVVPPKSLKIFFQIIPVELYVPNPLRCYNCQKFGHHEDKCPVDPGSVCERCGMGDHDHHTNHCENEIKCVNCGGKHLSRSNECRVWHKEKDIMRLKVTKSLTYPEARKLYEQKPEFNFSKVAKSLAAKPKSRTTSTQYCIEDTKITESTKIIIPRRITLKASTSDQMSKYFKFLFDKVNVEPTRVKTQQSRYLTHVALKPHAVLTCFCLIASSVVKSSGSPVLWVFSSPEPSGSQGELIGWP